MPDPFGINHLTLSTADVDRLVAYDTHLLGAGPAFERAAHPPPLGPWPSTSAGTTS